MNRLAYFINDVDEDNSKIVPCIAEENVAGYSRVNYSWDNCSKEEAKEYVDDMNKRMGISKKDALMIIASSMRAQNLAKGVAE